jgi:uncharacterized repeat protein (TIGR03943 family)
MWKGLVLRAIGLFLFFQWMSGKLSLYIHERFVILVVFASFGLVFMGAVYHSRRVRASNRHHHHHGNFSWGALFFVLLLIMFGLMAPRTPLGTEAMRNRHVSMESMTSLAAPNSNRILLKPIRKRTILDWVLLSLLDNDPEAFVGEKATVSGFVYRDEGFEEDRFMVSRFVVTCCAADALPVGLYVSWPESRTLAEDQWVEISGQFELRGIDGKQIPVLMAETVTLIDIPDQPYLYP